MTDLEQLENDLWSDEPQEPVEGSYEEVIDNNPQVYDIDENFEEFEKEQSEETSDFIDKFLMSRGIDPSKVRIADEQGIIDEIPFSDLSDEEKLAVLDTDKYDLSDEEIYTLNYLRQHNINLQEYTEYIKNESIKEYLNQTNSVTNIDDYTDEVIFKADLINRFGEDISDEELDNEWAAAQSNPTLLEKKIGVLREQFKQQEIDNRNALEKDAADKKEAQFQTFAQSMQNAAMGIDTIMSVEVDNEQKNDILNFCLERDINGQSQFNKFFENPEAVFKMAWFMKYGEQAIEAVHDYWKKQVGQSRKAQQVIKTVNKSSAKRKEPDPYGLDDVFGK